MALSYDRLRSDDDDDEEEEEEQEEVNAIEKRNKLYTVRKTSTSSSVIQMSVSTL